MAKKVFIGVLAALMLFAFVACDGGTAASGTITMVEATTSKVYVAELDEVKAEDFTFTGYTITGEPVNIPANQFKATAGSPVDNEAEVTFVWAETDIPVKPATVTMYSVDKWEIAAGTAPVKYYVATNGTSAVEGETVADYQKIKFEGLQITAKYNDETETREITVDADLAKKLSGKFGTIENGAFEASGTDGEYPTTAGDYVIQVSLGGKEVGTYEVTVESNYVVSTELYVDPDYALYTTGTAIYDGNGDALSSNKLAGVTEIYVIKNMVNGQSLKDTSSVAWGTSEDTVKKATSAASLDGVTIVATKGETTPVYAKYIGSDVATDYTRNVMRTSFAPITEEIESVKIAASNVKLVVPAEGEDPYSATNKVTDADISTSAFSFSAKYNSGRAVESFTVKFADETSSDNYTWYLASQPSLGSKGVNDTVELTINVFDTNNNNVASKTVTATLVASL